MRPGGRPRGPLRGWRASPFRPIVAHPLLRRLLPAFAVSALGDGMSAIAVALLAVNLAGPGQAAILVGAAVAAYTLPGAAGALLLARPLRRLSGGRLVTADAALRAVALGTIPVLYAVGGLTGPLYVGMLALSSVLHAWGISGRYTLLAEQLPHAQRLPANALLSVLDQGAVIVGPLLAGLIIAVSNPSVAIAADAASFAVLAVTAWAPARGTGVEPTASGAAAPERTQGFRFIAGNPALLGLLVLSCLFFLLYGPVEVALPLYVLGTLHGSAGLLAVFWAVFGTGAVIGGITIGLFRRLPLWPTALTAVIGWGAALLPPGCSTPPHRPWPASPSAVCSTPPTLRCPTPCSRPKVHPTCCLRSLPPAVRSPSSPLPSAPPSADPSSWPSAPQRRCSPPPQRPSPSASLPPSPCSS